MTTGVQRRRGTTVQHSTFTGLEGEITIDTTKDTAVVHDGSTVGGHPLARQDLSNVDPTALSALTGVGTASGDLFLVYDVSTSSLKKITRDELNNAIEQDALANVTITGGSINGTTIGASTASTGAFTTLSASGAFSANGGATLGDASGDALTINSSAVSIPNGLNFDSNTFVIDATNNTVGLGTASPAQRLHVVGNIGLNTGIAAGTNGFGLAIYASDFPRLTLRNSTTGDTTGDGLQVYMVGSDVSYNLIESGYQRWLTADTERMRITSAGNVGVGTSSPAATNKFQVSQTSTTDGATAIVASCTGVTTGANYGLYSSVSGATVRNWGLYVQAGDAYVAGSVGIGTTSPNYLLSVQANSVQMGMSPQSGIGYLGNYSNAPIGFVVNNSEKMRLDTSGNLGLGVTPSAWQTTNSVRALEFNAGSVFSYGSASINLYQNAYLGASNAIYSRTGLAAAYAVDLGIHKWYNAPSGTAGNTISFTQAMTLDASGRLLLNTTSARTNLFGSASSEFQVEGLTGDESRISAIRNSTTTATNGGSIVLGASKGTVLGSNTIVASGDRLGSVQFLGADGTGLIEAASIATFVDGTPGANDMPGRLVFSTTADGAASPTERMRLDSSGNLGLGVTPSAWGGSFKALQVGAVGSTYVSSAGDVIFGRNTYNNGTNSLYLTSSFASAYGMISGQHQWYTAPSGTAGNAITFTQAMTLDASGKLGIGTSSPLLPLHVVTTGTSTSAFGNAISTFRSGAAGRDASIQFSDGTNTGNIGQLSGNLLLGTGGNERMRIDSSGNVGIGTSSPTNFGSAFKMLAIQGSDYGVIQAISSSGSTTLEMMGASGIGYVGTRTNHPVAFRTNDTERMRIDSSGRVGINQTPTTRQFSVTQNTASNYAGEFIQLSATGHAIAASCNSSDTVGRFFDGYSSSATATRIVIYTNGNVVNQNNSYGAISDIKLKENIVDATPKLEKLNQVRVVNYNLIGEEQKQLGVIAQELEQIFPSMIDESPDFDRDGNDLGTTTKQVKYSVFVPMLIKAIQEQQAIITDLKSRIETLEKK